MVGGLKFGNKPLTIRWYLLTTGYTTHFPSFVLTFLHLYSLPFTCTHHDVPAQNPHMRVTRFKSL